MRNRVVITGAGVVSSLGDSSASLQFSLCSGRSAIKPVELFNTAGLGCPLGGEIPSFDAQKYLGRRNLRPLDRTSRLVTSAAQLALNDSGWSETLRNQEEVGLVLGTMFCSVHTISEFDRRALEVGPGYASPMDFSNTVINAAAGQTAIMHHLRGINSTISTGTTSGLQAIAYAAEVIRSGRARAILAGGADELCLESFYGFDRAGLLCRSDNRAGDFPIPFDKRRNGFALGEGAALLMLENAKFARERGARTLAEITGCGFGYDCLQGEDEEAAVEAIALSIRHALNGAFIGPHEIDCLSASANGSYAGDRHEAKGIFAGLNGQTRKLPVTAIKSMLGETLGASGPMQAIALLETMRDGVLPGIKCLEEVDDDFAFEMIGPDNREIDLEAALINSVGFDGHCCSLVLARCNEN
ncbi:MAG TPA: beta-ketoacyl-[acyl-carrier-protein] synthase family protein [Pyrinomonadaceae bacterium]|nr:beta-ketoacyl-[acyl-carrier-protein] synthase family protein [Pyrinomonadaceae bacterium]